MRLTRVSSEKSRRETGVDPSPLSPRLRNMRAHSESGRGPEGQSKVGAAKPGWATAGSSTRPSGPVASGPHEGPGHGAGHGAAWSLGASAWGRPGPDLPEQRGTDLA
jgi:hypothetical protein